MNMQPAAIPASFTNEALNHTIMATIDLNQEGIIQGCSAASESLFGYMQADLLGRHVSILLPKLEGMELVIRNEINPRLRYLSHCAVPFLARKSDGKSFAGEVFFNRLYGGDFGLQLIVRKLGTIPQ